MTYYEEEVKRLYPEAEVMYTGTGYFIYNRVFLPQTLMSDCKLSEGDAWESAYKQIKNQ